MIKNLLTNIFVQKIKQKWPQSFLASSENGFSTKNSHFWKIFGRTQKGLRRMIRNLSEFLKLDSEKMDWVMQRLKILFFVKINLNWINYFRTISNVTSNDILWPQLTSYSIPASLQFFRTYIVNHSKTMKMTPLNS